MSAEVLAIVFHFVITLAVLGAYTYSVVTGHEDATLRDAVIVIIGYWFGVLGGTKVKDILSKKGGGSDGPNG